MRHFGAIPDENPSLSDKNTFIGRSLCDQVSMKGLSMADDILLLGKCIRFSIFGFLGEPRNPSLLLTRKRLLPPRLNSGSSNRGMDMETNWILSYRHENPPPQTPDMPVAVVMETGYSTAFGG
ncbi:hypothetical protein AVEN_139706-1 [Araneus ventricosus]|uniref:Uncharacterized protein n=1 Tax=Araneus ventricosus TaxID=182803 RepID=A0A4Y2LIB1_ARAVE|nr:hypothetical protein AVEN_139706-1 [Araneus ventricosus]